MTDKERIKKLEQELDEARMVYRACHDALANCEIALATGRKQGDRDRKRIAELKFLLKTMTKNFLEAP